MAVDDLRSGPSRRGLTIAGLVLCVAALWTLSRAGSEVEQGLRHFAELQRQVTVARQTKDARAGERGRLLRLQAQARAASGAARESFDAQARVVAAQFDGSDRRLVRQAVLSSSLLALWAAPVEETPAAGVAAAPDAATRTSVDARSSGCVACHLNITAPGFETYPSPFKTHPLLGSYLGPNSPHPAARSECRECHDGNATAVTFAGAGHARMEPVDSTGAIRRAWVSVSTPNHMLPLSRTQASCVSCHQGEWYLPNAKALNAAYVAYDRGGCYACHSSPGYERGRKRGPDLRRIGAKVSADWVRQWLRSPKAVKPATWMPEFWQASDFEGTARGAAEIDAVVAYLFSTTGEYTPATPTPPAGDAARGNALVSSVGCLGCHITESGAGRSAAGLRRTFGPPLQALQGKLSAAWVYDWVSSPSRYSPTTQMPSLRLTSDEAADVTAYLTTLAGAPVLAPTGAPTDDELRAVARAHGQAASEVTGRFGADPGSLSGDALRVETGRRVIAALGCYQCHTIAGFEYQQPTTHAFPLDAPITDAAVATRLHVPPAVFEASSEARDRATWRRAPRFTLQPDEASALALAVTAFPRGRALSGGSVDRAAGRALVHSRNCVGCHAVEGVGGDFVTLVAEPALGPPLLTPEGSRVQPNWLRGFLREPRTIRPWLRVRMPSFGLQEDELTQAVTYFRAIAPPNPPPTEATAAMTPAVSRELFELLKCQQCHVLGSVPGDQPAANLAPDLRMAHERLQPEWIDAWLRSPNQILPGTRMPSFWPDFPTSFYPPLERDGAAQVRAIREHVLTLR